MHQKEGFAYTHTKKRNMKKIEGRKYSATWKEKTEGEAKQGWEK